MSAHLDPTRDAMSSIRQLRAQARAGVLSDREFDRLTAKIESDLEVLLSPRPAPPPPRFGVIEGGRP